MGFRAVGKRALRIGDAESGKLVYAQHCRSETFGVLVACFWVRVELGYAIPLQRQLGGEMWKVGSSRILQDSAEVVGAAGCSEPGRHLRMSRT